MDLALVLASRSHNSPRHDRKPATVTITSTSTLDTAEAEIFRGNLIIAGRFQ
jgi:hypothetical protein